MRFQPSALPLPDSANRNSTLGELPLHLHCFSIIALPSLRQSSDCFLFPSLFLVLVLDLISLKPWVIFTPRWESPDIWHQGVTPLRGTAPIYP